MRLATLCTYRPILSLALFALLCIVAAPSISRAQLDSRASGTTYVLAFPDTTINTFDQRFKNKMEDRIYIHIYSAVDNKVSIQGNGYNRVVNPVKGKFEVVNLTDPTFKAPLPIVTESCVASKNTFRLEAESPIVVYCYIVTTFGCEAWTPIPVEFWGTEYYAAALPGEVGQDVTPGGENNYNVQPKAFPAEITIVASSDNTVVTLATTSPFLDISCQKTFTLNSNEAYQVQSFVDTAKLNGPQTDFAGTHITSSKPIGVLSGNTRAQVVDNGLGLAKNSSKDMMMEWIAPVEQHGKTFVYMPTMDGNQLTGAPNEDPSKKRQEEWVRIYATKKQLTKGTYSDPASEARYNFLTDTPRVAGTGGYFQYRIGVPAAVLFRTDSAAQAFMNTTAVVQFMGTTGGGSAVGAKYDDYGTYSVELTPREQWVSFAPYYAPIHPANMSHYINVVADTNSAKKIYIGQVLGQPQQLFPFKTKIKGTDLIWGVVSVNTGLNFYLTGWNIAAGRPDTSVRFGGFVYGVYKGHEEYRPGVARKKDDGGDGIASADGSSEDRVLQHPSEYEEYLAVTYGYPLAPSRIVLTNPGDSLQIDTTTDCSGMTIKIKALNDNPVGIRSIRLENVNNAKLQFIDPATPGDIFAKSQATIKVSPIDPLQDASATVVITDRTGKSWRISYSYQAERVDLIPTGRNGDDADFGEVTLNKPSAIKTIKVTNPLSRPVTIKEMKFVQGNQEFVIIAPTVPPEIVLQPGQSIDIQVQITPTIENKLYEDSLRIVLGCVEVKIRVTAETVEPCIYVSDLDFGVLGVDESKTMGLRICNQGRGVITFNNSQGDTVISWLEKNFSVSQADKDRLRQAVLGPGECIDIQVTFMSSVTGMFQTTARFWASTRSCRDTSVWTAVVTQPSSVDAPDGSVAGYSLGQNDPNPLTHTTTIEFTLGHAGVTTLEVYNAAGEKVATLVDGAMEAGSHRVVWDASGVATGQYYYRLRSGQWTQTRGMIVR